MWKKRKMSKYGCVGGGGGAGGSAAKMKREPTNQPTKHTNTHVHTQQNTHSNSKDCILARVCGKKSMHDQRKIEKKKRLQRRRRRKKPPWALIHGISLLHLFVAGMFLVWYGDYLLANTFWSITMCNQRYSQKSGPLQWCTVYYTALCCCCCCCYRKFFFCSMLRLSSVRLGTFFFSSAHHCFDGFCIVVTKDDGSVAQRYLQ